MAQPRVGTVLFASGLAVTIAFAGLTSASSTDLNGDVHEDGKAIAGDYWEPQPVPRSGSTNWPAAATVIEQLKAHGIDPILSTGYNSQVYENNAHLTTNTPFTAVMIHDTGTSVPASRLRQTHSLNWILSGVKNSDGETVRASHFYVDRLGIVYFIYAKRTWHAGAGDSMFGIPSNRMNGYSYGIEIESQGSGVQDLTPEQITSATKITAALLEVGGLGVERAINHKDYAGRVQGKVDTAYPIEWWRSMIAAEMGQPYTAPSPPRKPVVSSNPKHVSLAMMKSGKSGTYVKRYQSALRKYAKKRGIKINKFNPNGATGYYGAETKNLTRALRKLFEKRNVTWRRYANEVSRYYPGKKLIRKIGMIPID